MDLYNIFVQFPNHSFRSPCSVNPGSLESGYVCERTKETGLVTTFHDPGTETPCLKELQPLFNILAEFYDFGAEYFRNGELSGEDVAKKIESQLGELWLGNRTKSTYGYHFIGVWPHSVNFGELCYSSDPSVDIEVTWKYKKIELCHVLVS